MPKQTSINQNQRVLNHLIDHGYITEVIARSYGIRRLASRIHDISKECVNVQKEMRTDDAGVRYTYYSLPEIVREAERRRRDNNRLSWRSGVRIAA
jgi:hypothetical protein